MRQNQRANQRDTRTLLAVQVYAILLQLYPRAHRWAFGPQMLRTFQDHYRDVVETRQESLSRFWLGVLNDTGRSLASEYVSIVKTAACERLGIMRASGSVVLAIIGGLLLLLGLRVWLSPALLSAPHGGGSALTSVVGLAIIPLVYALVVVSFMRARLGARVQERAALRRATLLGALLGAGALAAITADTLGNSDSPANLALWTLVVVAAPISWGWVGLLATRASGSRRLGAAAAVWSGMLSALLAAAGEVASVLLALPSLAQRELSNPDYLYWRQPDIQSYAIASALALAMMGLILAPLVASVAGAIGGAFTKAVSPGAPREQPAPQ